MKKNKKKCCLCNDVCENGNIIVLKIQTSADIFTTASRFCPFVWHRDLCSYTYTPDMSNERIHGKAKLNQSNSLHYHQLISIALC